LVANAGGDAKPLLWIVMRLGTTPKRMTSAREGSQACITGNERKDVTFAGCAMPEMCRPRAERRPLENVVAVRATTGPWKLGDGFASIELEDVVLATRFGKARAAKITLLASSTSLMVVVVEGMTGV
jgi:hypothetical protein